MISALDIDEALRRNMAVGINKSKGRTADLGTTCGPQGGGTMAIISYLFIKFSKTISEK
jgi:hypothetical protein